jgi:hypothetical protein
MKQPKKISKLVFWLILGFLSTFFAEALSGSAPDFFLTGFGYFGIFPIYALHSLLLAALVISRRKPFSLRTLYLTSLLFGMYEAYITKVLWPPPWNDNALRIANVAITETGLLVLFWHSIFSFMLPLFWIEGLTLSSNQLGKLLPVKWQGRLISYRGAGLTGILGGILSGSAIGNPDEAVFLMLANCLIMSLMLTLGKLAMRKNTFDLADLLPHKSGAILLGILLVIDYLIFGLQLRREVHPGITGQAAILILYALIGLSIHLSMHKDDRQAGQLELEQMTDAPGYTFKHWLVLCLSICVSALVINFIPQEIQDLLVGVILLLAALSGVLFLILSLLHLFKKHRSAA